MLLQGNEESPVGMDRSGQEAIPFSIQTTRRTYLNTGRSDSSEWPNPRTTFAAEDHPRRSSRESSWYRKDEVTSKTVGMVARDRPGYHCTGEKLHAMLPEEQHQETDLDTVAKFLRSLATNPR